MSPSESDLRAALRDGEGDSPDVGRIVASGAAARARRRTQLTTVASAVVLVGAIGVTGGVLFVGNGQHNSADNSNVVDRPASTSVGAAGSAPTATPSAAASRVDRSSGVPTPEATCPSTFPRRLLPGGGSSGQFGSTGPLFTAPVATIVVCSYGSGVTASGASPARAVLSGLDAVRLQDSLDSAATARSDVQCPPVRPVDQHPYVFIGVDPSGRAMRAITTTLTDPPCDVQVTNGTAVRYDWQPASLVRDMLLGVTPGHGGIIRLPKPSPSGVNGSPPR